MYAFFALASCAAAELAPQTTTDPLVVGGLVAVYAFFIGIAAICGGLLVSQ